MAGVAHDYWPSRWVLTGFGVLALASVLSLLAVPDHAPEVHGAERWVFGVVFLVIIGVLASEKVDKTIVTMLGAGLCLFLAFCGPNPVIRLDEHVSHVPFYIEMIEWPTIGIIVGTSVFVELVSRSGFFTWSSVRLLKASRGNPVRLLVFYSILTVLFSAFLNNVTAMVIIGSLTVVSAQKLEFDPKPFLIVEGILTNVGGLLTLVSSIPNIIVGQEAGITYLHFLVVAAPYTVVATAATLVIARWKFREEIPSFEDEETRREAAEQVERFDEWETVEDMTFFRIAAVTLIVVILLFSFQAYLPVLEHLGLEYIAFGAATFMLVLHPRAVSGVLSKVEWSLVFFFLGLFVVIGVMEHAGVLEAIGRVLLAPLEWGKGLGSLFLLWSSAIISSVTDNIPLSAVLANILGNIETETLREILRTTDLQSVPDARLAEAKAEAWDRMDATWWSVILGSNLGGNISPIGSASTVVAITIMAKNEIEMTFLEFVRIGGVFAFFQLLLASAYLLCFFVWM